MSPRVSVVIPVLNGAATIGAQLSALADQVDAPAFEVLVCDNGSTDETRTVVAGFADRLPGLRVVDASDRRGAAHARNVGIQAAAGEIVAFCDADDVVAGDWVRVLADTVHEGHLVAGWLDLARLNLSDPQPGEGIEDTLRPLWGYLPSIGSGNVALTTSDARRIGGFDESYRYGVEDIDFGWRAQQSGLTLSREPATVAVRIRDSLSSTFSQHRNWGRGNVMLQLRHQAVLGAVPRRTDTARVMVGTLVRLPGRWRGADDATRRELIARAGRVIGEMEGQVLFRRPGRLPQPQLLAANPPQR